LFVSFTTNNAFVTHHIFLYFPFSLGHGFPSSVMS
jgi:hypothetical protein